MFSLHSWKSVLITGLCLISFYSPPALAQETDTAGSAPPTMGGLMATPKEEPKSWYPRLTGLPVDQSDGESFFLGDVEYSKRDLFVSFFAQTTGDQVSSALDLYKTENLRKSDDGSGYYLTLSDPNDLFPAVDAYNDLAEVRTAHLIRVYTGRSVPPSPLGPYPASMGPEVADSAEDSLLPGDVDGNFQWRVNDASRTLRTAVGLEELSGLAFARADVNRNGKIDVRDAILTLGLVVGKGLPAPYGYPR